MKISQESNNINNANNTITNYSKQKNKWRENCIIGTEIETVNETFNFQSRDDAVDQEDLQKILSM